MDEPPFALVCGWRYPLLIIAKGGSFSTVSTLRLYSPTSIACGSLYEVEEIAQLLAISNRAAYNLCNTTKDFKVIRLGTSIRVSKQSFDDWFAAV